MVSDEARLLKEVRANPAQQDDIISNFVPNITLSGAINKVVDNYNPENGESSSESEIDDENEKVNVAADKDANIASVISELKTLKETVNRLALVNKPTQQRFNNFNRGGRG